MFISTLRGEQYLRLKRRNIAIHILRNLIRLPLLQLESPTLIAVVVFFIVRLVLVIFDAYEAAMYGFRVQRERDESIDGRGLGGDIEHLGLQSVTETLEGERDTELLILKLCHFVIAVNELVSVILGSDILRVEGF